MTVFDQKVFETRRARFGALLEEQGVEVAVVGQPLSMYYLTGIMFHPYERLMALCFDVPGGRWRMLMPSLEKDRLAGSGIEEVTYEDSQDPGSFLAKLTQTKGKLGVEMDYFSMRVGKMMESNADIVNISDTIVQMRRLKDESEAALLQTAADCAEKALAELMPRIEPGMTEKDISLALFGSMSNMPGVITETFIIQILAGERAANPHGTSGGYVVKKGDGITIDFGAYYEYYWSDITRNVFVGQPDPELSKIYNIVLEANLTALARVRPGIPACEVDKAARTVITKAGYGENFIHRTGHGLGLEIHEAPSVHSGNDLLLEPGMVFTVEPGIYIPGLGGVRIEDDVMVTPDGCRVLTSFTKDYADMVVGG